MMIVGLKVTCKEGTNAENLQTYCEAAQFIAQWMANQDGAKGKEVPELFDEFKANVTEIMKSGVQGNA